MDNVTIAVRDLSFAYDNRPVLHGLNLDFRPGGFHAMVGPNGSGKSTLLALLAAHLAPSAGSVTFNDQYISSITPAALARQMALVPQETAFSFPFTVFETVLMGRHPHIPRFARPSEEDLRLVRQAMEVMDLTDLADRTMPELSGGERQRTVFARALAQDAPCLLLDEPTSSMDIRHALAAMTFLRDLAHSENRTIVAVLHDLNQAANHCDSVTVLDKGTVYAAGSPGSTLTPDIIGAVFGVTAHVTGSGDESPYIIHYES